MKRVLALLVAGVAQTLLSAPAQTGVSVPQAVKITIRTDRGPVNRFVPSEAFGAGVDGREFGDAKRTYTKHNLARMQSAGFTQLTYRLRTELAVEAWHWNPRGHWSDHKRGYWTSDAKGTGRLPESYGYRLPRRGSTSDQANNDGYSRVDDGDPGTFWKSNPYLDEAFTHEPNDRHTQWLVIDFGNPTAVNAIRIFWGEPYARSYTVESCSNPNPGDFSDQVPQCWVPFPQTAFTTTTRKARIDRLAPQPVMTRFIRILLDDSCRCLSHPTRDIRDRVGYAVRELQAGVIDEGGGFEDAIVHSRDHNVQTEIIVSSTDPWHTAADKDLKTEQPSFDRVVASGLTHGNPMLLPVGVLYDTPANAAAEIAWLLERGIPVTYVEMGEEPDGQYATPEDYGALYIQFAEAIHNVAPQLKLGGPCFQTTIGDYLTMPLHGDSRTWLRRFIDYLSKRGHLDDFTFFSLEWYPFDNVCVDTAPQLADHVAVLTGVLQRLQRDGLSREIPWFVSEYGYSAFGGRPEVDIEGALLNADTVGLFLTLGGTRTFLYGLEPNSLMDELGCNSWGNNAMFLAGADGQEYTTTAIYSAARLINEQWVQPGEGVHELFVADSDQPLVSAYAVRRPDRKWGLLVVNKDPAQSYAVSFPSDAEVYRYSREQYVWKAEGEEGHPIVNLPPLFDRIAAGAPVVIPPYSISVVRISE